MPLCGMPFVAEWPSGLGKGLQSPVHGFDSRLRLSLVPGCGAARSSTVPLFVMRSGTADPATAFGLQSASK